MAEGNSQGGTAVKVPGPEMVESLCLLVRMSYLALPNHKRVKRGSPTKYVQAGVAGYICQMALMAVTLD